MKKKLTAAVLGAGGRGSMYADLIQRQHSDEFDIAAICDINPKQLEKCKKMLNLTDNMLFTDEEEFLSEKRADVLIIATYDDRHIEECTRAMRLGYDILMEKPVSNSREEIDKLLQVQKETGRVVSICHELRYGPAFVKLGELVDSGIIGELLAVDAMERVAYWHQAQAYVRIQSQRTGLFFSTILAKCSHDLDLVQRYVGSRCDTVSSVGDLSFFKKENMPKDAAHRCLDCKYVEECPYSAKKIYIDMWKEKGCPEFEWPWSKVSLVNPNTEEDLYEGIKNSYFGECVFDLGVEANKDVVDRQMVQMRFENGVIATLKMVFAAEPGRRFNMFGSHGEIVFDERVGTIEVLPYGKEKIVYDFSEIAGGGHGGGDSILIGNLYNAITDESSNRTSLADSIESQLMGIAAEESRFNGGTAVKVHRD